MLSKGAASFSLSERRVSEEWVGTLTLGVNPEP